MKNSISFLIALTAITSCSSTPKFELDKQAEFNPESILGNWVCTLEKSDKSKGNHILMSSVVQEHIGENGSYTVTGSMEYEVNEQNQGSMFFYMVGDWVANQSEFMTRGDRVKTIATPGSKPSITKISQSPTVKTAFKRAEKSSYSLNGDTWLRTEIKTGEEYTCMRWGEWQKFCSDKEIDDCGKLLDANARKQAEDRFFSDN